MRLHSTALLFFAHRLASSDALVSNAPESPQILSDTTGVCNAQGRTSNCEVELDVPAACVDANSASACPVVFFFHGAGGTNDWFKRTSGVHDRGVIGVYPQGEDGWNTGPKGSNQCQWEDFDCTDDPDEGAFIASIISELRLLGAAGNVYLIGNSNGAALSMRLASNAGDDLPIKGMVTKVTQLLAAPPRSGPGSLNHNQPDPNGPPVSVLNVMGTADMVIPYEGGSSSVFGGDESFQLMSALDSMDAWSAHNGCGQADVTDGMSYATTADPNGQATYYSYRGCPEGIILEHYAVHGAGHSFGAGATLNGLAIDHDLAYEFIERVEEGGEGGGGGDDGPQPTPATTPGPSPAPDSCEDDPDWSGKFNEAHDCAYVALSPGQRCVWEDSNGVLASEACEAACDACAPVDTPGPTPSPTADVTPSPTAEVVGCEDDSTWRGKFNEAHDCEYVSQSTGNRCNWEDSNGVMAWEVCVVSCGTCGAE